MLKHRLLLEWLAILLLAICGAIIIGNSDVGRQVNNFALDALVNHTSPAPSDKILIVEIDDRSLSQIGRWPWPRTVHAKAIRELGKNAPAVVAYDILFSEPSNDAADRDLAAAMKAVPTAIPLHYQVPGLNGAVRDTYLPIQPLREAAASIGNVALEFGEDGLVRTMAITGLDDGLEPHLMEQALQVAEREESALYERLKIQTSREGRPLANRTHEVIIPFQSAGAFRKVSFLSVLAGEIPQEFISGKIVIVGASAPGLGDSYAVPAAAGSTMPGVEIQANFLNGLMSDSFLAPASLTASALFASTAVFALMLAFLILNPTTNLALSLCVMAVSVSISAVLAVWVQFWLPPVPALIGVLIAYPIWGWRRLAALSRAVGEEIVRVEGEIGLGPRPRVLNSGLDRIAAQASDLRLLVGKLSEVQAFTANVINSAPDAMCVLDAQDRIILVNSSAQAAFGLDPTGLPILQALGQFTNGSPIEGGELESKDGRTYVVNRTALGTDPNGAAVTILQLADITEMKDTQREREDMLEFLSHDMRSPQVAIINLTNSNSPSAPVVVKLERIREHARQTLKLADDFVQLARLNSVELKLEQVDLASIAAEAIDRNHTYATERSVKLVSQGLEAEAFILADSWALHRALSNLIDNAIKYGPIGGTVHCCLQLNTTRDDNTTHQVATLTISDEGDGVSAERIETLFNKYGGSDRKQTLSSGLGLAFVKRVIDRLGGRIEHSTRPEGGTQFKLVFPELF